MNPFDEINTPYSWEIEFYQKHNIPTWECKTHETHDLGTIYEDKRYGGHVKAKVTPMPAQLWEFEIYSSETGKTTVVSTGSGGLQKYFFTMKDIADGMIVIESQKEQKI